jgi:hypothetical protein
MRMKKFNVNNMVAYDIECYPNFFHIHFDHNGEERTFSAFNDVFDPLETADLYEWLKDKTVVGWNNHHYDDFLLSALLNDIDKNDVYYQVSKTIIETDEQPWNVASRFSIPNLRKRWSIDSVDVKQIIPGRIGLKIAGVRIHHNLLMELPFNPHLPVNEEQAEKLKFYCSNDVAITKKIVDMHSGQFHLRQDLSKKYKLDLRSKGDASIANLVLANEYANRHSLSLKQVSDSINRHPKGFYYTPPPWVKSDNLKLQELIDEIKEIEFQVGPSGAPLMPEQLKNRVFTIGNRSYAVGIGGLHSIDSNGQWIAKPGQVMCDLDVTSYYPAIMLLGNFHPKHMGEDFGEIYRDIVNRRVKAKKAGNKTEANSLKIVANGTFGQMSQKYSYLYDPSVGLHTTVTGQLSLLILIDRLWEQGIDCVSANTDGVTLLFDECDEELVRVIAHKWEKDTGFNLERADYAILAKRDVNSYIAIQTDGKIKSKGSLSPTYDIMHNPSGNVILESIIEGLKYGSKSVVIEKIFACKDLTKFLIIRKVQGGATDQDGNYIGSVVRWYWSTSKTETLNYVQSGNKVPDSEGAQQVVDLPTGFPTDVDYDRYIEKALEIWDNITQPCELGRNIRAEKLRYYGFTPVPSNHSGSTVVTEGYDFSSTPSFATQTGEKTGLIAISTETDTEHKVRDQIESLLEKTFKIDDWYIYRFQEEGWPSSWKFAEKKGFRVAYGSPIPLPIIHTMETIRPLPDSLREVLFTTCPAATRRRIDAKNLL